MQPRPGSAGNSGPISAQGTHQALAKRPKLTEQRSGVNPVRKSGTGSISFGMRNLAVNMCRHVVVGRSRIMDESGHKAAP